jgi:hypothetical protein
MHRCNRLRLEGNGLLAEDLLAGLGGVSDQLDVQRRGGGDHDRLDLVVAPDPLVRLRVDRYAQRFGPFVVDVRAGNRLDPGLWHGMQQVPRVHPADPPRADDADRRAPHRPASPSTLTTATVTLLGPEPLTLERSIARPRAWPINSFKYALPSCLSPVVGKVRDWNVPQISYCRAGMLSSTSKRPFACSAAF